MKTPMFLKLSFAWLGALVCLLGTALADEWDRVRLDVVEPPACRAVREVPVAVGLIFPKGKLTSARGAVVDDAGRAVPCEMEVTGWWEPEKTNIKWLLLRFRASSGGAYFFERGAAAAQVKGAPIATREAGGIAINTGPLRVTMKDSRMEYRLHDAPIARAAEGALVLKMDDGAQDVPVHLDERTTVIEEATPLRASIKSSAFWKDAQGTRVARVEVRCEFFAGEAFMRVEHTLTWMVQDVRRGIRELSFGIAPAFEKVSAAQFATDGAETFTAPLAKGTALTAHQGDGKHFSITRGGETLREGATLGGSFSLRGADGRGISIALRHAWQRYPVAFRTSAAEMRVMFSPPEERLSFEQEAIMTPAIFQHPCWKRVRALFKGPTDVTSFYDNYSPQTKNGYLYTAEGAAFTHEMLVSFSDAKTTRDAAEMNRHAQQPLALRQDPRLAMQTPFMGFDLAARDAAKHPDIERAVDQLGRMAMGRWVDTANFGLLRFGMTRWSKHQPVADAASDFYRWMDGTQYSQQLIPWLLWMRGNDRRFLDDALIVSRYAMDMHVNHFNTRGCPAGYMAGCGCALPFKPFPFQHYDMKMQKIHYLAHAWHLTGDRRAKEVMDEVIAGTKAFTLGYEARLKKEKPAQDFYPLTGGGRETYNMNVFWINAWEETFDPEIRRLAENNRKFTVLGLYKPEDNTFNEPLVYLFDGLVPQQHLTGDEKTQDTMLRYLGVETLGAHGGLRTSREDAIALPWAFEKTRDRRCADAAWDIARGLADLVPDVDFDAPAVPAFYPDDYIGNSLLRLNLMPILVGTTFADKLGLDAKQPRIFHDTFFQMWRPAPKDDFRAEVFVRPRKDGALKLRCLARGDTKTSLQIEITNARGDVLAHTTAAAQTGTLCPFDTDITVPNAKAGEVLKLTARKADRARFAVIAAAPLVHHLPLDHRHAHEPLNGVQNATPMQFVTRTTADTMSYFNRVRRPCTLRDAATGALLFRPKDFTEAEASVNIGRARLVTLTTAGCRGPDEWTARGVEPYFADSAEHWFHPAENGFPQ